MSLKIRSSLLIASFSRLRLVKPFSAALISQTALFNFSSCSNPPQPENPLNNKVTIPRFAEIEPKHAIPAVEKDLKYLKDQFTSLEKTLQSEGKIVSYANIVEELEKINAPIEYSWGVVQHLMAVKNSNELREAQKQLQPKVIEISQEVSQSAPLYNALTNIKGDQEKWNHLDEPQQRIIENKILSMKSHGIGLSEEKRIQFNKLDLEKAELSTKFSNNLLDSTKLFKYKITDPKDTEGLPASTKAMAAQTAKANGDQDATPENGPWVITLDIPSYLPCMQHLKNRDIREQLYRAYISRASTDPYDNAPLIQRILQIKLEKAKMLGYDCYADLSLASKMAPNVETVMNLIEMLRDKSYCFAKRDFEDIKEFAKSQGFEKELELWDIPYWSERLREAKYEFKEEELRSYFSFPEVLQGLFKLANRLFGIKIVPAEKDSVQLWHPDVLFFNVLDEKTGEHIASFFLDPYSRPAEKRGGAWMNVCLGKSKVLNHKPVAYLVCNGSPPVGETPSLMTFREVETLFHEFGHGLQHMLTRVEHGDAAGINNIEWDAVELPSQFMENWCYDHKTLYSFAKHYQTGEPLPEELFQKLKASKNFQAGLQMMRQLFFGATDMFLHSKNYDPYGSITPFDVQQELAKKYTVKAPLKEDKFLCSFSHIFAGGYSAGYYSYKWAEVMSADAFGAFEEAGLENEEAVKATGRRFRETVLSLGGGKHPSDVYKLFRGREPSPEALLRHSGLLGKQLEDK